MRKTSLLLFFFFFAANAFTQQVVDIEETAPYTLNGLEYGFYVTNERNKEVKGENYDRFELSIYVTNKSGCIKLLPLRFGQNGQVVDNNNTIAEFTIKNATGKRLTSKGGKVEAQPWYTNVKLDNPVGTPNGNTNVVNAQVGFAVKSGQTVSRKIIVIVPKGERPKVNCQLVYIPDLN
jgi:hypothetical protein